MTLTSVSEDARAILNLLMEENPHLKLDKATVDANVEFSGTSLPNLPGCIKSGAVSAATFAVWGALADQMGQLRYKTAANKIRIDTDHAGYFLAMVFLFRANGHSLLKDPRPLLGLVPRLWDGRATSSPLAATVTNVFATKDGRYYQLHGGLDPDLVLHTLGLAESSAATVAEARDLIAARIKESTAQELESLMIDHKHSGNTCYSPEEWLATDMGQALANCPLYYTKQFAAGPPVAFPPSTDNTKILEGIKVIEFARIIAGPTIGYLLASLGAQVIKINASHLKDLTELQFTLTTGKHTVGLNAKDPQERQELEKLVGQADVFINGYRPGALERLGFGKEDVQALVKRYQGPDASVVYADESCYGIEGPYQERSGWEQTSDAASGVSYIFGQSLGLAQPRIPVVPVTDHLTGLVGATSILCALRDRAVSGGAYHVVASLTRSNMFQLSPKVGYLSQEVMDQAQALYQWPRYEATMDIAETMRSILLQWQKVHPHHLDFDHPESFTTHFDRSGFGVPVDLLAPVVKIDGYPSGWRSPPRPFAFDAPSFD